MFDKFYYKIKLLRIRIFSENVKKFYILLKSVDKIVDLIFLKILNLLLELLVKRRVICNIKSNFFFIIN